MKRTLSLVLAALALTAAAPSYVPVHGVLTDASGKAITTLVAVRFSLHDAKTAGTELWFETQNVTPTDGVFTAYLGQGKALDLATFKDHGDLWLEVKVGSDEAMERFQLGSAAFGAYAEWCGNVPAHAHAYTELTGSVPTASLPAGMVVGAQSCAVATEKAKGFDAAGKLQCGAVAWGDVTGKPAGLVLGQQACTGTNKVKGIKADGTVDCDVDQTATAGGGITGSGNVGQVPYFTTTSSVGGSSIAVDGSGNVGIGTGAPAKQLHVSGTGTVGLRAENGTVSTELVSSVSNVGIAGTFSNHPFTLMTNNAERMRVDGSGNVGIGTTPATRLHVAGNDGAGVSLRLQATGTSGNSWRLQSTNTGATQGQGLFVLRNDTTGVDAMVADPAGNLLLNGLTARTTGTGYPPLTFWGSGLDGSTNQRTAIYSDTTYGFLIEAPKDASNNKVNLTFGWRGGGAPALFARGSNGYVGVGTSTPNAKLHVVAPAAGNALVVADAAGGAPGGVVLKANWANGIGSVQGTRSDLTAAAGLAINPEGGNVGIGTTAPAAKLEVAGDLRFSSGADRTIGLLDGTKSLIVGDDNGPWATHFRSLAYLNFRTAGVDRLRITSTGNVGIGTISPDATLSVAGTASKTGGGSWATFSDARLKDVGSAYGAGLSALLKLQPVRYRYKEQNAVGIRDGKEHVGLVAQNVREAIPEAVSETEKGYLLVDNDPILWTMLNGVRELKSANDSLRTENDALKARVEAQAAETKALEERLSKLEAMLSHR